VLIASGLTFCAALAAFALCPWFWPGVALLVVVGVSSTVFTTMIATVIQLSVPGELRGRVISLYSITLIGLPSLGALGVAALARGLGDGAQYGGWVHLPLALLDALGVDRLTERLGPVAGAPRAILLGVLALVLVLATSAPAFLQVSVSAAPLAKRDA
jgi:hypothetical protein